jgi:hypothetical protein
MTDTTAQAAMIEAIALAISRSVGEFVMPGGDLRLSAAAVLALVGPKPLVWVGKEEDCYITCDMGHKDYDLQVCDTLERPCDYVWSASYIETGMGRPINLGRGTLEAMQAAAQAHADAAHWANTPLGDLITATHTSQNATSDGILPRARCDKGAE